MMANPLVVEVMRGSCVESRHRGAVAICDADGAEVLALGDVAARVFPRSAVKALQALPLVESGAADACGYGDRQLALSQASHGGEPAHVAAVAGMLAASGCDEGDLECGTHLPSHAGSAADLIRHAQEPCQLHNNCSGKHANFLALARQLGVAHRGYVEARHPVQQAVRDALASVTGAPHGEDNCAIDGCSIPTYALPLRALAGGFARFATGTGLPAERARAAGRLYRAAVREPFFVAGTDRFCTDVMGLLQGEALVKTGAEGVFCAAIPRLGLGIALKCDDGATRAAEAMMAAVLTRCFPQHEEALRRWTDCPITSRRGVIVGSVRAQMAALPPLPG